MRLSALATAGLTAAACAGTMPTPTEEAEAPAEEPKEETPAETSSGAFKEAPMWKEMVEAGELPPVDERLPMQPMVIDPIEEIGQYGGTWHRAAIGPGDRQMGARLTYENLVRWKGPMDIAEMVPNVAESWEVNEDSTEFTFHLREGMKWSDGEPFTVEDWLFWYEDILLNEDLNPVFPSTLRDPANGEPMVLEKIDDYTFKITFSSPYGLFMRNTATSIGLWWAQDFPKHYMKQFHPNYVDEAELAQKVTEAGFDNWWELWGDRGGAWGGAKNNPENPRIWAWVPKQMPPATRLIDERNPYYWKVDPEGNQLPYIDQVIHDVVEDAEMLNMKAVAGNIDMQFRHIIWTHFPLFKENAEKIGYRVFTWQLARGSDVVLPFNMNHEDPVKRELFQMRDFRAALSVAIDRNEINELVYMGMGTPRQMSLIPDNPYFKQEHAEKYAEYDPDLANSMLDEIGLTEKDDEGFRKTLTGEELTVTIEYAPVFGPWGDVAQIVSDYWKAVGIRTDIKEEARPLFAERCEEGHTVDVGIWMADRCATPLPEPHYFMPISGGTPCGNAADWYGWYLSRGEEGEEPPEAVKRQYELYNKIKGATSQDALDEYAQEFFDNASEQVWYIGIVGLLPHVGIVKENFRNVPEQAISDWLQQTPGNTTPEQYFIRQS
jgi:peptide/nickel transport system substrate-binding protein